MNQFLAGNEYRRYPFQNGTILPFPDTVVADAAIVLASAFDTITVELVSVTKTGTNLALVFSIVSTALSGYTLEGTIDTTAANEIRIPLTLKLSGVAYPNLGYGFLMIGQPAAALVATATGLTAALEPSVIRPNVADQALVVRVANKNRAGGSTVTYTPGTPATLSIQNLVSGIEEECIEYATLPSADQLEMEPSVRGDATTAIPIPSPAGLHAIVTNGSVTTITTTPATQVATIPSLPSTYDAVVDTGPVATTVVLTAGFNVKLSGTLATNTVQINYQLAAGAGMDCSGILGYASVVRSAQCIKSINGVYPSAQDLVLTPADGIAFLPDQYSHQVIILVNPINLARATPP